MWDTCVPQKGVECPNFQLVAQQCGPATAAQTHGATHTSALAPQLCFSTTLGLPLLPSTT